jgi:hypothetical protein
MSTIAGDVTLMQGIDGARRATDVHNADGVRSSACTRSRALKRPSHLVRQESFDGPGIEVEVWAVPEDSLGGFVAAVPPPLTIGNVPPIPSLLTPGLKTWALHSCGG